MKNILSYAIISICIIWLLTQGCTSRTTTRGWEKPPPQKTSSPPSPKEEKPAILPPSQISTPSPKTYEYKDTGIAYPLRPLAAAHISLADDDAETELLFLAASRTLEYYDRLPAGWQYRIGKTLYSVGELKESILFFLQVWIDTGNPEERDRRIRGAFDIYYAPGGGEEGKVVTTGYYKPVLQGSLERTERFRYPLYGIPDDLVVIPAGKNKGRKVIGRMEKGRLVPYYSRADIDGKKCLAGKGWEIAWVDDPVELFYLHIQGSGRIILPDGREMNVGFAQSNGRAFKGASACLLEQGKIRPSQASHQKIKQYLRTHSEALPALHRNESYIFFRVVDKGPIGALGVPLTSERSIAADLSVFPRGGLAYLKTRKPVFNQDGHLQSWQPFGRFVFIQDTGSAIKGPGRLDLFCGSGDEAERIAGSLKEKSSLYFLVKKKK